MRHTTDEKPEEIKPVQKARISVDDVSAPLRITESRISYDHIATGSDKPKVGIGADSRISMSDLNTQSQSKKNEPKKE